jgi:hypothetical protein
MFWSSSTMKTIRSSTIIETHSLHLYEVDQIRLSDQLVSRSFVYWGRR